MSTFLTILVIIGGACLVAGSIVQWRAARRQAQMQHLRWYQATADLLDELCPDEVETTEGEL